MAYPGTMTLRPDTYARVIHDLLNSLIESGFRRILMVNGHGGNAPAKHVAAIWAEGRPGLEVRFHDWWKAPRTWAKVLATDPTATHASWSENFPWTRLPGIELPERRKPPLELPEGAPEKSPRALREMLGDGSFGGRYWRPEEQMMEIWVTAVAETRALLEGSWKGGSELPEGPAPG
jgi:creatinine amidohydrolase